MAAWEEHVCVAWQRELAPGVFTIRARRSGDAGSSWSPAPESVLSSSAIASRVLGPEVVTAGEYAFVVWVDDRAVVSHDVYLNLAPWSGSFAAADIRLNVPPAGATSAGYLDIATSERAAYVVLNDDRDGYEAVYLNTVRP